MPPHVVFISSLLGSVGVHVGGWILQRRLRRSLQGPSPVPGALAMVGGAACMEAGFFAAERAFKLGHVLSATEVAAVLLTMLGGFLMLSPLVTQSLLRHVRTPGDVVELEVEREAGDEAVLRAIEPLTLKNHGASTLAERGADCCICLDALAGKEAALALWTCPTCAQDVHFMCMARALIAGKLAPLCPLCRTSFGADYHN